MIKIFNVAEYDISTLTIKNGTQILFSQTFNSENPYNYQGIEVKLMSDDLGNATSVTVYIDDAE